MAIKLIINCDLTSRLKFHKALNRKLIVSFIFFVAKLSPWLVSSFIAKTTSSDEMKEEK